VFEGFPPASRWKNQVDSSAIAALHGHGERGKTRGRESRGYLRR